MTLVIAIIIVCAVFIASTTTATRGEVVTILVTGRLFCSHVPDFDLGSSQTCTFRGRTMSPVDLTLVASGLSNDVHGRGVTTMLPVSPLAGAAGGCGKLSIVSSSGDQINPDGTWSVSGSLSQELTLSGVLTQSDGTSVGGGSIRFSADPESGWIVWVLAIGGSNFEFAGLGSIQILRAQGPQP